MLSGGGVAFSLITTITSVSYTHLQELLLDKDGNPQKEEVEITIPAFRAVSVFDLSQTDGKPIPELTAKELLSDVEGYQDMIRAVEAISPVPIELEEIAGDSKGYYDREAKRIAVQELSLIHI